MSTTTAAAPARPTQESGGFTHRQILVILSGLMLGMFLAALDQNIVSTSIRTIADDLQGLSLQAWATTAYLITATISTPLYGKLSDLYGRKPFFLAAIGIFVVGSLLCTFSTSMYELAGFRALQGLGAGGLMSLALTIIGDIVPPRQRARYQGYFLAVFGTSSVVGPVVGGFLAGQASILGIDGWRWVFLVNVPIGAVALVVVAKVLNLPHNRREHRLDFPGAAALAMTLVPLLIVAEQGREWGWASTPAFVCYAVGLVGLILFLLAERAYGEDALLPLRLFRNGVFSLTSVLGLITGIGMFGGIAIVPQYLQIVNGSSPTAAGLQMIPMVGGLMIASVIAGQVTSRTGRYKIFPVIGLGLMTLAMVAMYLVVASDTPYWQIAVMVFVFGFGAGNCMQTLTLAVQNAVPAKDMGVATASATFFRQMGGTIGVAVFLSILFSTVGTKIGAAFSSVGSSPSFQAAAADPAVLANPANRVALNPAAGAAQVAQDSSVLQRMDGRLAEPFLVGFADSMDIVFLAAAIVVAVGFVLIWFLRELPLRTQSGIQARDAEARQVAPPAEVDGPSASAMEAPASAPAFAGNAVSRPSELAGAGASSAAASSAAASSAAASRDGALEPVLSAGGALRPEHASAAGPRGGAPGPVRPGETRVATTAPGVRRVPSPVARGGGAPSVPSPDPRGPVVGGRVRSSAGATMTLHDLGGTVVDRGYTEHDGRYLLRAPRPGTYMLVASSEHDQPHAELVDVPEGGTRCELSLTGAPAAPGPAAPVATRAPGTAAPVATSRADGTVRDTEGAVVPGASVTLTDAAGAVRAVAHTDAGGRWTAAGLEAGVYTATVLSAGREPVAARLAVGSGPVAHEIVVPVARFAVHGAVHSATGVAVAESLVVLVSPDGSVAASTVTGEDGSFRVDDLEPGRYMLTASGYAPVSRQVHVTPGEGVPAPVDVTVEPPRPVRSPAPEPTTPALGTPTPLER